MTIGGNLKKLRVAQGLTQDQLAEKLHVTRQAVSNWERNVSHPELDQLEAIAAALGVEVMIEKGEADLVIGSRFINKEGFQTSGMRRAGINILNTVLRLCGHVRVTDATSGFRAASRGVITFFAHNYAQDYPEPESIIAVNASGFKVKEVPVIMNERTAGVSSISPWKSVYYMIKVTLAIVIYRIAGKKWR